MSWVQPSPPTLNTDVNIYSAIKWNDYGSTDFTKFLFFYFLKLFCLNMVMLTPAAGRPRLVSRMWEDTGSG